MATDSVRIRDYSDRELLAIVGDLARANGNPGGAVEARAVAVRVFGVKDTPRNEEDLSYFSKCVTARFTWMRRFGLLEKGEHVGEWFLSEKGNAYRRAKLTRAIESQIASMDDELIALAHAVGDRMVKADDVGATAIRREILFQAERRKMIASGRYSRRRRW